MADDLYIAFSYAKSITQPTLTIIYGDVETKYTLRYDLETGKMYNITDLSKLTKATE